MDKRLCSRKVLQSTEIDEKTENPVIDILPEQRSVSEKGGTMRLGACPAILKRNTKVFGLYGSESVSERHRHRYEVNPEYLEIL